MLIPLLFAILAFQASVYAGFGGSSGASSGVALGPGGAQAYNANLTTLAAGGAGARTFLVLTPGTDVEAHSSTLTTLASSGFQYTGLTTTAVTTTWTTHNSTASSQWRKTGKMVRAEVAVVITSSGPGNIDLEITPPAGWGTIDEANMIGAAGSVYANLSYWAGTGFHYNGNTVLDYALYIPTAHVFRVYPSLTPGTLLNGTTFNSSIYVVEVILEFPVQ